jgi:bifunctional enzyme CysN/CysC
MQERQISGQGGTLKSGTARCADNALVIAIEAGVLVAEAALPAEVTMSDGTPAQIVVIPPLAAPTVEALGILGDVDMLVTSLVSALASGAEFSTTTTQRCHLARLLGVHGAVLIVDGAGRELGSGTSLSEMERQCQGIARAVGLAKIVIVEAEPPGTLAKRIVSALAGCLEIGAAHARRGPRPLRFWLSDSDRTQPPSRYVAGELVAGAISSGAEVIALPSAALRNLVAPQPAPDVDATRNLLELDRALDPAAGDAMVASAKMRPEFADQVAAHVIWLASEPMLPGRPYLARLGPQSGKAQITLLKHKIKPGTVDAIAARKLEGGEIGLCNVAFDHAIIFDSYETSPTTGRFVLSDTASGRQLGLGLIAFGLRRATNIHWQALAVDQTARATLMRQRPCCLWFTGLSGSGKSTIASLLDQHLSALRRHTYILDGDNVRHGLNRDLGFTDADRVENIRRVSEVARLFVDAGLIVMVSFISPFKSERRMARRLFKEGEFIEIYLNTPLEICEGRDPKGLYAKARAGQLKNFTGLDSPYEIPERAEVVLPAGEEPPGALVERVLTELTLRGLI